MLCVCVRACVHLLDVISLTGFAVIELAEIPSHLLERGERYIAPERKRGHEPLTYWKGFVLDCISSLHQTHNL